MLVRIIGIAIIILIVILCVWIANDTILTFQLTSAWQPWVTVFGIVIASFFAVWPQWRIDQREILQRRRKSIAARAVMPAALAQICQYAEKCTEKLKELYTADGTARVLAGSFPVPDFPTDSIGILKECVEYAEENDARRIADCIRKLQIHHSRISRLLQRSTLQPLIPHVFDNSIVDTIDLHAYCSSLYAYARIEKQYELSIKDDELILSSCVACNIYTEDYPGVFEIMKRMKMLS